MQLKPAPATSIRSLLTLAAVILVALASPLTPLASSAAPTDLIEVLPPCVGGPNLFPDMPPAPLTPGQRLGPTEACKATATYVGGPLKFASDPGTVGILSSGYHHLGAQTNGYSSAGIKTRLGIVNPAVSHTTSTDFLANRIMAKNCDSSQWIEVGWAEVGWRGDAQYVYTYDTSTNAWAFYDTYALSGGTIYVSAIHVGAGNWQALLWWNAQWNVLVEHNPGSSIGCGNEQYVEVYTTGTESYGDHFTFSDITNGDGTSTTISLAAASTAIWESWSSSISSSETNLISPYDVTWTTKYNNWVTAD